MKPIRSSYGMVFWYALIMIQIFGILVLQAQGSIEIISLSNALNITLEKNPGAIAVRYQREAAEAQVWEARSGFLPQLSVSAGYTQYQEPNIILPIHQIGVFPPLDDQIYETSFQMQMPIFSGGRTVANTKAAKASVQESQAQEDLVMFGLMERIGQTFIQARQLQDNQSLVTARIQSLLQRHREMSLLLEEGRISPGDLALVNASTEAARADSLVIESQKMELAYRLGQLLGSDKPLEPDITNMDLTAIEEIPGTLFIPDTGEITGPMVLKSQAQLNRAEALKSLTSRSFWPEISGFAVYNYRSGSDLDMIGEWAAGLTLRLPLFEGGRRIASVNAAQANARAAEQAVLAAQQEQNALLQIAITRRQSTRSQRGFIESAVESKAKSVKAQHQMYEAGRVSLGDVLVQETELLQLQIQERALAYSEILAILNYHANAGTLTVDKVREIVRSSS